MKPDRNDSSDEQAFARYRGRWIERALADRGLSDGAFRTLAGIAHHFLNRKERKLWAAQDTIAAKLGISRRSVQEHLKELRERGLIRSQRQGRDKPNHYFPVVDDAQNSACHDGDEARIFAHQKSVMKRRSASDDAQDCVIKTREDLRTNTWKEPIEEPMEGGAGLQPASADPNMDPLEGDLPDTDVSTIEAVAPSVAPEGASGATSATVVVEETTLIAPPPAGDFASEIARLTAGVRLAPGLLIRLEDLLRRGELTQGMLLKIRNLGDRADASVKKR